MGYKTNHTVYFDFLDLGVTDYVPFETEELHAYYLFACRVLSDYDEEMARYVAESIQAELRAQALRTRFVDEEWAGRAAMSSCILGLLGDEIPPHRFEID